MIFNRKSAISAPMSLALGGFLASAALFGILSLPPGAPAELSGGTLVREAMPAEEDLIASSYVMPAAKNFVEIVMRPIFAPNRRPTAQQELSIETMTSELEIRLIGVIVTSGSPIAIVAPRGSKAFARLTVGDRFQGWTVAQIEPQRVTFRRGKAVERVELSYDLPPNRPKRKNVQTGKNAQAINSGAKKQED